MRKVDLFFDHHTSQSLAAGKDIFVMDERADRIGALSTSRSVGRFCLGSGLSRLPRPNGEFLQPSVRP